MSLREYQAKAIEDIRAHYAAGRKRVLLHLATGGGKTHIFSYVIKQSAERGKKCIMVVRGRQLVDQASQRLEREGVRHGVRMAGHWRKDYQAPVQVCSVDTLISREDSEGWPDADLVVIDEVHMATSDGYHRMVKQYPDAFFLGVTATPFTDKPLRHLADVVVSPIGMKGLVEKGFLVPFRYFAPSKPNLKGVKISASTKDFVVDELALRMKGLTGDVVSHWISLAENRPTILFAVRVEHSQELVSAFRAAGVSAEHCDADTSDSERKEILKRLETGETKVVCNVGILCTGVDMPYVRAIVMARPTTSYNLFIQQAGRGTRLAEGKSDCLILDHAGNLLRHGLPTAEPEVSLDGKGVSEKHKSQTKSCPACFAVYECSGTECPECGFQPTKPPGTPSAEVREGVLAEIAEADIDPIAFELSTLKLMATMKGYKPGWAFHKLYEKFGAKAEPYLPNWFTRKKSGSIGFSPTFIPMSASPLKK